MKKILLLCPVLFLSFLMLDGRTVKKVYEIDGFNGIEASDAFNVTVEKSSSFSVEIEVTEEFLPYVSVRNRSGILELSFNRLPVKLKQKDRNKVAQAVIKMPSLNMITLNGASSLTAAGSFSDPMGKMTIDLNGASTLSYLDVRTPDVILELSGASRAVLNITAGELGVRIGGASKVELTGTASSASFTVNGASRVSAAELVVEEMSLKAGGASKLEVNATGRLSVNVSGASRCVYTDHEDLNLRVEKVSGASSIKSRKP